MTFIATVVFVKRLVLSCRSSFGGLLGLGRGNMRMMGLCDAASISMLLLVTMVMGSSTLSHVEATRSSSLKYGFYKSSCPDAEKIVFREMQEAYAKDHTVAPGIVRLIFHDCFVRGCDGSVLLDGPKSEKTAVPINAGLHGFDAIDRVKSALEKACPGVVSCADILAFASRDSVILSGGKGWQVPSGRRDGRISRASEPPLNLPTPTMNAAQLISVFNRKGLSAKQMSILSGSHTIGIAHCAFIFNRLFNYPSSSHTDPGLPEGFLDFLQRKCPNNSTSAFNPLSLDVETPGKFDIQYWRNIVKRKGLLTSDQTLLDDERTRPFVYKSLNAGYFGREFGEAMVAMSNLGVLTGHKGEIRKSCRIVNT